MELPKQYDFIQSEKKWKEKWDKENLYAFDPKTKGKPYTIDTPPPTVSGNMHIGHAFSYAQEDFIARFRRMHDHNVFYPFGTDDNGLPTERYVEKLKKVRSKNMQRKDFIKLCIDTLKEIKPDFIQDWKDIGMSCDFNHDYSTIDEKSQRISQRSFIELHKKGLVFEKEYPTMWCVSCQTAIAQAELEDKELSSTFNDVFFELEDGKKFLIATTRPELIGACVCIFAHPEDKRYKDFIGKKAKVPLFNHMVPIIADETADMEKGTGIMMICCYGDNSDVEAVHKYKLEPRVIFTKDGRVKEEFENYAGLKIVEARKKILEDLEKEGILKEKKQIMHVVNAHDKCGTEIEFLPTKQWFIKILDKKKELLKVGKKINWYPQHMQVRYEHWIEGLQWDWCVSRQRHFGVPIPVWKCKSCGEVKLADEKQLPVDPLQDKPEGKCKCGGSEFIPESDVLDTWATSSCTPQIALNWKEKDDMFDMFPMTLRPQAHDIIRTWAFYTIVKGLYHENKEPWQDIVISGHALDPRGKKMSKSKGNVIDPRDVLGKYGADAMRFWAAGSKLGDDLSYQEKDLVTGRKMVTKLWNASKFVMMNLEDYDGKEIKDLELMDKWLFSKLMKVVKTSTDTFMKYEYSRTKQEIEKFFWNTFCDQYLESIKDRIYNPDKRGKNAKSSAQFTLYNVLLNIIKLVAPIMPFITEEIYHLYFAEKEGKKSIHVSDWPKLQEKFIDEKAEKIGDVAVSIISAVRRIKTSKNLSLKAEIKELIVECDDSVKKMIEQVKDDVLGTVNAQKLTFGKAEQEVDENLKITVVF